MILPWAMATISMVPKAAQRNAAANTAMIVQVTMRPTGDGGFPQSPARQEKFPGLPFNLREVSWSSAEHGVCAFLPHGGALMAVLVCV